MGDSATPATLRKVREKYKKDSINSLLRIRIRCRFDPLDPVSENWDPGSRSGMNFPDHISVSLETGIFLTLDPGSGNFCPGIQDEKNSHAGSGINIPDPQN